METYDSLKSKINSTLFYYHYDNELIIVDSVDEQLDWIKFHYIRKLNHITEISLYGFNVKFSVAGEEYLRKVDGEKKRLLGNISKLEALEFAVQYSDILFKKATSIK